MCLGGTAGWSHALLLNLYMLMVRCEIGGETKCIDYLKKCPRIALVARCRSTTVTLTWRDPQGLFISQHFKSPSFTK